MKDWDIKELWTHVHGPLWRTICLKIQIRLSNDGFSMHHVKKHVEQTEIIVLPDVTGHNFETYYEVMPSRKAAERMLLIIHHRINGVHDL